MSGRSFLFDPKKYDEMADFLKSKGYEIEYDFKNNPIYPEYVKSWGRVIFFIKGLFIYIDKPLCGKGRPEAAVNVEESLAPEWKEHLIAYQEGKKSGDMTEYIRLKKKYDELKKKIDKAYSLLKRKFELKERLKVDDNKEEKKGFFGRLFGSK